MLTLCDVATFALQFLVTEDVRELSAACKDIFAGPPCMSRSCHARAWRLRAPHTLASLYQLVGRLHLEKPNLHHLGSTLGHFADVLELDISFPPPLVGITSPPPPLDLRALLPRLRVLRVRERAARHCLPLFDSIAALPPSLRFVDLQHVHARDRALGALWRPLREHPARLLLLLCACCAADACAELPEHALQVAGSCCDAASAEDYFDGSTSPRRTAGDQPLKCSPCSSSDSKGYSMASIGSTMPWRHVCVSRKSDSGDTGTTMP